MAGHRFSSTVELRLLADSRSFELAQIGPGYVILREHCDVAPCDAEILVTVDGDERRIPIRLIDGVQPFDATARTVQCIVE